MPCPGQWNSVGQSSARSTEVVTTTGPLEKNSKMMPERFGGNVETTVRQCIPCDHSDILRVTTSFSSRLLSQRPFQTTGPYVSLQSAGGRFRFLVPPSGTTCLSMSHLRRHSRFLDNDSTFLFSPFLPRPRHIL